MAGAGAVGEGWSRMGLWGWKGRIHGCEGSHRGSSDARAEDEEIRPNRAKAHRAAWTGIRLGSADSLMRTPSSCAFHVATL